MPFDAHLSSCKCTLQCVLHVHFHATLNCASKCTFVLMYIGGTLYAMSTKYIQCTLEVVINAQNSVQILKITSNNRWNKDLKISEVHVSGKRDL